MTNESETIEKFSNIPLSNLSIFNVPHYLNVHFLLNTKQPDGFIDKTDRLSILLLVMLTEFTKVDKIVENVRETWKST